MTTKQESRLKDLRTWLYPALVIQERNIVIRMEETGTIVESVYIIREDKTLYRVYNGGFCDMCPLCVLPETIAHVEAIAAEYTILSLVQ